MRHNLHTFYSFTIISNDVFTVKTRHYTLDLIDQQMFFPIFVHYFEERLHWTL